MSGKLIVITGCNTGIGEQTAYELAKRGADIVLACRSHERTKRALDFLTQNYPKQKFQFIQLDLSSLQSVKTFVQEFGKNNNKLDILINNAGVFATSRQLSQDGIELTFSCHIGHQYLTNLLQDYLKNAQPARIINVSSDFHKFAAIKWDDINFDYNDFVASQAYIQTKTANIMHAKYLQKQLDNQKIKIKIVSLHPGLIRTEINRNIEINKNIDKRQFIRFICVKIVQLFSKTPLQGAQTSLHCSLMNYDQLIGGGYYSDSALSRSSRESCDDENIKKLWDLSQNLIQKAIKSGK